MYPCRHILLLLLSCSLALPGLCQKKKNDPGDPFGKPAKPREHKALQSGFATKEKAGRKKEKPQLPDFYARAVKAAGEHSQLPSFFTTALKREKERTEQPDHFSKKVFNRERAHSPDHFAKPSGKKEEYALSDPFLSARSRKQNTALADHFSARDMNIEHTEDDLYSKGSRTKRIWRKNYVGERYRIFDKDPNGKKQRKAKRKKSRDPFGKDRRELDQAQPPRGESGLFPGGVLPKMDDPR